MISADIRIEGFDARTWSNLAKLLVPINDKKTNTLVLIIDRDRNVVRALGSLPGATLPVRYTGLAQLPELTTSTGYDTVWVIPLGALTSVAARASLRLDYSADYISQCLTFVRAFREAIDDGTIAVYPRRFSQIPIPTTGMLQRALDLLIPRDHAAVLGIYENQKTWASLVIRRGQSGIDLLAGPDLIAAWTGPLGGDWRRDHRVIVAAVEEHVAPVHLGLFCDRSVLKRLLQSSGSGHWAAATATRELVFSPNPTYVRVALAADAARSAARRSAQMLGGVDLGSRVAPFFNRLRGALSETRSISTILGFDPLAVLAALIRQRNP